jgi:hypothetical protein
MVVSSTQVGGTGEAHVLYILQHIINFLQKSDILGRDDVVVILIIAGNRNSDPRCNQYSNGWSRTETYNIFHQTQKHEMDWENLEVLFAQTSIQIIWCYYVFDEHLIPWESDFRSFQIVA